MPYEIFLALRYLRSRHKRRLTRVTAAAAILGIAMGVGALIVALALSNGFRDEMRDKILQGTAHLSVLRSDSLPMADYLNVSARIRLIDGVVNASATTYDGAVATGPKRSAYAVLRGAENEDGQSASFQQWLREGSFTSLFEKQEGTEQRIPPAVIGAELAKRKGMAVGNVFQIIPASVDSGHNPVTRRLRVVGI